MSYNPERQYRCTIIRGRAKGKMDNLLPAYSHILESICPCAEKQFPELFNKELSYILPGNDDKTYNNHRTEIAGKLFGMFYVDDNNLVQISQRTQKLTKDNDQPAFFKEICYKFQFPNGMDSIRKIKSDIENNINIRQCSFILEVLIKADSEKFVLSLKEAAYYILNSLDVLQGKVSPNEVIETIISRRKNNINKSVESGSHGMQHIRETFNYLELANLLHISDGNLFLNKSEKVAIDYIASFYDKPTEFDLGQYDLDENSGRKKMYLLWQQYYSKLVQVESNVFKTSFKTMEDSLEQLREDGYDVLEGTDTTILGEEGEIFVYTYEKNRVKAYSQRLARKVLFLGKTRGLGFDIQSVRADKSPQDEHAIYLEVKTTKRVTAPNPEDTEWIDTINLTRNEWMAADQHRESYSIYRVYFTPDKVIMFVINDPASKSEQDIISVFPEKYRVKFDHRAGIFK